MHIWIACMYVYICIFIFVLMLICGYGLKRLFLYLRYICTKRLKAFISVSQDMLLTAPFLVILAVQFQPYLQALALRISLKRRSPLKSSLTVMVNVFLPIGNHASTVYYVITTVLVHFNVPVSSITSCHCILYFTKKFINKVIITWWIYCQKNII